MRYESMRGGVPWFSAQSSSVTTTSVSAMISLLSDSYKRTREVQGVLAGYMRRQRYSLVADDEGSEHGLRLKVEDAVEGQRGDEAEVSGR